MPTKTSTPAQANAQHASAQRAKSPPPTRNLIPLTSLVSSPPHPLSKFKQRSHDTHHSIHLPELNARLALGLDLPMPNLQCQWGRPDLMNTRPISVVYLGSSMLERFKTTGSSTRLGVLCRSGKGWNAGVGGDKNESVLYRLDQGLRSVLSLSSNDITVVVLASGTNNLHLKSGLKAKDVESWSKLLDECLALAPHAEVIACDVFHRVDIPDEVTEAANVTLKAVVDGLDKRDRARVRWVEARHCITRDMLVDHVHLNEEGYAVWDGVLWPVVKGVLGGGDDGEDASQEQPADAGKEQKKVVAKTDDREYGK